MAHELRYPDVTAHHLVAETCVALANEVYETLCMRSNELYRVHRDKNDFIRQCAPTLRQEARKVLGQILADPMTSETEKEKIYDALCLDASLPKDGTSIVKRR